MPGALAAAELVIARAGALTLAELALVGRPAILIPLPTAAADHQTTNAHAFARRGAAVVLLQDATSAEELARQVTDLLSDDRRRTGMAEAMRTLGRPRAVAQIVDALAGLGPAAATWPCP